MTAAERHRTAASDFTTVVDATTAWDAPTPVPAWRARDVVAHLVEWFPAFLAAGGVQLPPGPPVADDPAAAWRHQTSAVQALLDDDERASATFAHPQVGELPRADAIDRFYTADVFMHTWDLARASRRPVALDPARCDELLAGLVPMEAALRASGHFGSAHPVAPGASAQDRLMAFIGRDPAWRADRPR